MSWPVADMGIWSFTGRVVPLYFCWCFCSIVPCLCYSNWTFSVAIPCSCNEMFVQMVTNQTHFFHRSPCWTNFPKWFVVTWLRFSDRRLLLWLRLRCTPGMWLRRWSSLAVEMYLHLNGLASWDSTGTRYYSDKFTYYCSVVCWTQCSQICIMWSPSGNCLKDGDRETFRS